MSDGKKYKVTAPVAVLGHEPGEEFTDTLSEDQERQLKDQGAIRVVEAEPTGHNPDSDSESEGEVEDA